MDDFGDAGLFAHEHGHIIHHRFEGRYAKRLGNAGHDVEVARRVHAVHLVVLQKARERESVAHAVVGHAGHDGAQHVT